METVNAILGGGIRVGVVFQGKKVRDDQGTLQQAGISQCSNLDSLDFTLEQISTHVSPFTPKKVPVVSPFDADHPMPRYCYVLSNIINGVQSLLRFACLLKYQ